MPTPANAPVSMAERLDPALHAALARCVASLSHASALMAASDWAMHLAASPGHCMDLAHLALRQGQEMASYAQARLAAGPDREARHAVEPPVQDRRFADPAWQQWPFNLMHQSFVLTEQWWAAATHGVWGVEKHHEDMVAFAARQFLDVFSPGNQLLTNPVVLQRTVEQGGANLVRGALNLLEDARRQAAGAPPAGTEQFVVGRDVGITPGKVVLKNRLMELIQYAPTTKTVHPEPILIVPAWIMKYYILDLSPNNSLIKYLVDNGHTVFCISWKNPGAEDRDLGMDDYLDLGFRAALNAVNAIVPHRKVHAAGYCLGGTLLAIAAAAMARDSDDRLASMTMFAAQTDFTEPGELGLFIDDSQISLLEAQMAQTGYLTAAQMAGAFQMLRSYDLLWSRLVNEYLLGDRPAMNDLMAWNADATRMPARMHSQYLRRLFLNDDLSEGRYPVDGKPVTLSDITLPAFMVGTVTDHVAPWRSVFKLQQLSPSETTFVLTSGGHNAGIVSPPGHPHRHFQMQTRPAGGNFVPPDDWLAAAPQTTGSWWPAWLAWLQARSGAPAKPPRMGAANFPPLGDAPGTYVLEK
ncbi:MAG TPA: poly-beta-hydroxybutyrate polymerase [Comamonadaceae bacterium]|nr:poly-beta-hydroxybutyrate polymerase [Comamonadaceae bacterium]